jgi:hypothetical protein
LACSEIPQSNKIAGEYLAIPAAQLARIHQVLHVSDSPVQSALIKSALRPAFLKPGEVLLSMSEMVALVVIHIRIPIHPAQIGQSPIDRRSAAIVAPPISVGSIAISISLVVRTIAVWTVLRTACSGRQE